MPDASGNRSSAAPRSAHIVSHTHWDREWYLTFHQFRVHLVSTVKAVLDELEAGGAFRHFLLDGQTAAIEDFLEIAPEERETFGVFRQLLLEADEALDQPSR